MKVVVTGANGAVGTYVVKRLLEAGHSVVALDITHRHIRTTNYAIYHCIDLSTASFQELQPLISGAQAIIHAAAIVDIGKSKEEIWPLNVTATRNLAILASQEPSCKFIYISSGSIYAASPNPIKEDWDLEAKSPYEESKIHAEAAIHVISEYTKTGLNWTILRPALIYGPRAKFLGATLAIVPSILKLLRLTNIEFTGGPITNLVHAEDVARAAIFCIHSKETDRRTLNVADNCPISFGDLTSEYIRAYGLRPYIKIRIPNTEKLRYLRSVIDRKWIFDIVNTIIGRAWQIVVELNGIKYNISAKVDKEALPYMFCNTVFDNTAIKDTGFTFRWPDSREAIPYVISWYGDNGWIP